MKRDHSKMLTIAPKMEHGYDEKKNQIWFNHLNHNILGYITASINFLKLAGESTPKRAKKKQS